MSENRLSRPPRLLFISYPFPPLPVIGCVRTWNIAKHLTMMGWDVTVVTVAPELWRKTEDAESVEEEIRKIGLKRLLTGFNWPCLSPDRIKYPETLPAYLVGGVCRRVARCLGVDPLIGWYKAALQSCKRLSAEDCDIILATGTPFISFEVASRLSAMLNRPFVIDYRDTWSDDPHPFGQYRRSDVRREDAVLSRCKLATVVSSTCAEVINARFGFHEKMHVVSNGYDSDTLDRVEPLHFDHPAIVYAGSLFPPKRVLDPVMMALRRLLEFDDDGVQLVKLHYYGPHGKLVEGASEKIGLQKWVVNHGSVSRSNALSAQKGAGVNVVIATVDETGSQADKGIVTGKVFDSIGMRVPIMGIAPLGSDLRRVIDRAGGGKCFVGSDVEGMANWLRRVIDGNRPDYRDPEAYSWKKIAEQLDGLLRAAITEPVS